MALFPQDRQIVIVGAGYAGLHAAAHLAARLRGRAGVRVTLISEQLEFVDRCRLHERAVREAPIRYPLEPLFAGTPVELAQGEVDRVNLPAGLLHVKTPHHGYELPFDDLFLATGSQSEDCGVPGAREHALTLHSFDDAERLRRLLEERARQGLRLAIVGGGLTGVELAAELADWAAERPGKRNLAINLLEAAGRLLPGCREEEARYCQERLEGLGVTLRLGAQVGAVTQEGLHLGQGSTLKADRVIWCAGVRGRLPAGLEGLAQASLGRIPAGPGLETPGAPRLLIGGDVAALTPPGRERPLLPKAQWAVWMGRRAGRILAARALGGPPPSPEAPEEQGELISLGRGDGCGWVSLGGRTRELRGLGAALLKDASLLQHLWELSSLLGVAPAAQ